ncbi:MAG: phosphatidylinositol mannoside acyltransferase [Acidimicrobiales bacterium]
MPDRTTIAYRAGSAVARALPAPVIAELARVGGAAAGRLDATRRAQVERNLRRVHGQDFGGRALRRAVTATFESYARYWAESFRLPGTSPEALDASMSHVGYGYIDDALAAGNGAILATPHLGAWEWGGCWVASVKHHPVSAVVEALEPREVFEWFAELRGRMGVQVIPLGPEAGTGVMRALKANHVVCLFCDRDVAGGGIEVEFFGERTRLPAGPATLALRTGAPILPTAVYLDGARHCGVVRAPLAVERQGRFRADVARITQALACELEALIRVAPEQWHLMQPNWPSDPGYVQASRSEP